MLQYQLVDLHRPVPSTDTPEQLAFPFIAACPSRLVAAIEGIANARSTEEFIDRGREAPRLILETGLRNVKESSQIGIFGSRVAELVGNSWVNYFEAFREGLERHGIDPFTANIHWEEGLDHYLYFRSEVSRFQLEQIEQFAIHHSQRTAFTPIAEHAARQYEATLVDACILASRSRRPTELTRAIQDVVDQLQPAVFRVRQEGYHDAALTLGQIYDANVPDLNTTQAACEFVQMLRSAAQHVELGAWVQDAQYDLMTLARFPARFGKSILDDDLFPKWDVPVQGYKMRLWRDSLTAGFLALAKRLENRDGQKFGELATSLMELLERVNSSIEELIDLDQQAILIILDGNSRRQLTRADHGRDAGPFGLNLERWA